ncbi:unnamed protein product [Ostreobium quekettii]|uniref:cyclin-dependent kinase n=1 Tax=Ostreobium quekettii TaxID=121088 RepID=A0A8S1IW48_9CHLO|nr:unnamed protein product [Ostreobium quekettii]|eukprot:evm.model.scf_3.13 EVM.evm.TU.scf_3.13   scf_3:237643-247686(-)
MEHLAPEGYTVVRRLGSGTHGCVTLCECLATRKLVAVKSLPLRDPDGALSTEVLREASVHKELRHPNVVCLLSYTAERDRMFLILEAMDSDLAIHCRGVREGRGFDPMGTKILMYQLLRGVGYLHEKGIVHRDLTPRNVLLKYSAHRMQLKLADYGLSRSVALPCRVLTPQVVTLWYRAPEVLLGSTTYSEKVDIWSVGCIFAEMATGRPIFPGTSEIEQLQLIFRELGTPPNLNATFGLGRAAPEFPRFQAQRRFPAQNLNAPGVDLLWRLLCLAPKDRVSCGEALRHPYFAGLSPCQRNGWR